MINYISWLIIIVASELCPNVKFLYVDVLVSLDVHDCYTKVSRLFKRIDILQRFQTI